MDEQITRSTWDPDLARRALAFALANEKVGNAAQSAIEVRPRLHQLQPLTHAEVKRSHTGGAAFNRVSFAA